MTITNDRKLPCLLNKSIKFKTKNIVPSFVSTFSFFLNHLRITIILKYAKPESIIICAYIKKRHTNLELQVINIHYYFIKIAIPLSSFCFSFVEDALILPLSSSLKLKRCLFLVVKF